MAFFKASTSAWMLCVLILFALGATAFTGDFDITKVTVDCPSEKNATSPADSFLCFDFADQGTPEMPPSSCCLQWAAGHIPATLPAEDSCSNSNMTVYVPDGSYIGFQNMTVKLANSYEDNSVGQAPYNVVTKYAELYLQYPTTPGYECDMDAGCCELCEGKTIIAVVVQASS